VLDGVGEPAAVAVLGDEAGARIRASSPDGIEARRKAYIRSLSAEGVIG